VVFVVIEVGLHCPSFISSSRPQTLRYLVSHPMPRQ
jgi:hypothetical protein